MSTHFNEEFRGIVVKRQNYRERDMLVTIFTDHFGFKTFFLRGAHKRGFKMRAAILPFTHGTYIGKINDNGFSFITTTHDVEQYKQISQDIILNAYASYILELARQAFENNIERAQQWFDQIAMALNLINEGYDSAIVTNIIEVRLLGCFGVQPNWHSCVICGDTKETFDYSEGYGGLLCQNHWHLDPNRLHLDQRTLFFLRKFSVIDLTQLNSIKVKESTKYNLRRALDEIYNNQVGVYIKAKKFLDHMDSLKNIFDMKKKSPSNK